MKLWSFYCDLEESLGTLESAKAVYDRILELRIATPQIVLNYALFLQACFPTSNQTKRDIIDDAQGSFVKFSFQLRMWTRPLGHLLSIDKMTSNTLPLLALSNAEGLPA